MHEYLTDLCNVYEVAAWSCALHVCTKLHSLVILALTLQGTNIVEVCNLSPIVKEKKNLGNEKRCRDGVSKSCSYTEGYKSEGEYSKNKEVCS